MKKRQSPKLERPCSPKLVHFISTSICIKFLSQFYFLTPWTTVHGLKEKLKQTRKGKISETREAMPNKIGLHAFYINLYLHGFFEPALFFDYIVHDLKGKFGSRFGCFAGK